LNIKGRYCGLHVLSAKKEWGKRRTKEQARENKSTRTNIPKKEK
jgi:hypothetical protein